jgi:hypothetical protein
MKRRTNLKYTFLHVFLLFTLALGAAAFAAEGKKMSSTGKLGSSRPAPARIPAIDKDGIRYSNDQQEKDFVVATQLKNGVPGKVLWKAQVLNYWNDPKAPFKMSTYFKSMVLTDEDSKLLITDETTIQYLVDLKTHKVSMLNWPVRLQAIGWAQGETNWSYRVKLVVHNSINRVMKLDEPSVAYGGKRGALGQLSNDLFNVTVDGKEVRYMGPLARRAPPDHFFELKAGETYEVVVELGEFYKIPPGVHDVVVQFEHRNHFSPDGFVMKSQPLAMHLEGTWELTEKAKSL